MGLGSRGGKRIRVNVYQNITTKDVVLFCDELNKEFSNGNKNGIRVWENIYKTKPIRGQRPENCVKEFVNFCLDRDLVKPLSANYGAEYWLLDKNLTKKKRLEDDKLNSQA